MTMSVTIKGVEYAVDTASLSSTRWSRGSCSSNFVSWHSETTRKEIRLGAAFLSGVYA